MLNTTDNREGPVAHTQATPPRSSGRRASRKLIFAGTGLLSLGLVLAACNTMADFGALTATPSSGATTAAVPAENPLDSEEARAEATAQLIQVGAEAGEEAGTQTAALTLDVPPVDEPGIPRPLQKPTSGLIFTPESPEYFVTRFDAYWQDVTRVSGYALKRNSEIRAAHKRLGKYDAQEVSRGWLVTQALKAMEVDAFLEEAKAKERSMGRTAFLTNLRAAPHTTLLWNTSAATIDHIAASLTEEHTLLTEAASRYRDKAIRMQTGKGRRAEAPDAPGSMESFGAVPFNPTELAGTTDGVTLANTAGLSPKEALAKLPPYSKPTYANILSLAAFLAVDDRSEEETKSSMDLVVNRTNDQCMRFAKLNLAQCLAASRNLSEEAFCTGRHGLNDVATCFGYMIATGDPT